MVANMEQYHPITKSFWRFLGTFAPALLVVLYYAAQGKADFGILWPMLTKKGFAIHLSLFVSLIFRSLDVVNV